MDLRPQWQPFISALRSFPGTVRMHKTPDYQGDILAVWGACGTRQWAAVQRYREAWRPVICLDVGYFQRSAAYGADRQIKISINGPHSERLPPAAPDRFDRLGIDLQHLGNTAGPVVVAGMGEKSRRWLYGMNDTQWESAAIDAARQFGRDVVYRPKDKRGGSMPGAVSMDRNAATIEQVLAGASLVVSRHSNVCHVDAVVLGVPAAVETGPGVNLWPRVMRITHPSDDQRLDYLRRLAWWSWSLTEMQRGECWDWILDHCG